MTPLAMQLSHQSHDLCTPNCRGRERNGVQWRTKIGFGRTTMLVLEMVNTSQDEEALNSEEIKPVAIANIELHLSERIS